jgi:hypothetical protein
MPQNYAIIETDAGLTVAELRPGESPEQAAEREAAMLIDPGPYKDYQDACEAIVAIQDEEDEEDDEAV